MTVVCLPSCAAESKNKMQNGEIIATSPFFLCIPQNTVDNILRLFAAQRIQNLL